MKVQSGAFLSSYKPIGEKTSWDTQEVWRRDGVSLVTQ